MDIKDLKEVVAEAFLIALEEAQLKARISTDAETGMGATISGDPEKAGKRKKTVRIKDLIPFEPDEKMETPEARSNIDRIKKAIQSGKKLPPLVTRNTKKGRQVIDGHHRLKAHKELGTKKVQIARPSKISVEPNMTKIKAREQIKNAVLNYLEEGYTTGGEDTADRLGKWFKGTNPNAKPGKEGYMRKRNVPPTGSKYDPTKHKAPEEGKPLEYMKPQHKDYARNQVNVAVSKRAMPDAERDTPIAGNIQKRHAEVDRKHKANVKRGEDTLDIYGAKNPPLKTRMKKWIAGNNPKTKDNPEGYVRSDGKPN